MCSVVAHVIFDIFIVCGIGLSIAALATPGWIRFKTSSGSDLSRDSTAEEIQKGFFTCGTSNNVVHSSDDFRNCVRDTWNTLKDWEKATFGCLVAGAALGVIALLWSFILCCCLCCCDCYCASTLPLLAFLGFGVDLAAVVVYGVYVNELVTGQRQWELGYSIWLGVAAAAAYFIDIFIGACLCTVLKRKSGGSMV